MRDIDREIGLRWVSDEAQNVVARAYGERLLYADELEETVEVLRSSGRVDPDVYRDLEREAEAERRALEALEARGQLDYARIDQAMVEPGRTE